MIISRLEADRPTVIPGKLLAAPGLKPGDEAAIDLVGNKIVIASAEDWPDRFLNNFSTGTEWASGEDKVFDDL